MVCIERGEKSTFSLRKKRDFSCSSPIEIKWNSLDRNRISLFFTHTQSIRFRILLNSLLVSVRRNTSTAKVKFVFILMDVATAVPIYKSIARRSN